MVIQWYPGHMTKAIRMMEENVKLVDVLLYVLDARCYKACLNPSFDSLTAKPRIYVLNKIDTIERADAERIKRELSATGHKVVTADSIKGRGKEIVSALTEVLADKIEHFKSKGINKTVRAMVVGVPNSGKSTMVNSLCGGKKTITGDRPGVTRGKQWVAISDYVNLLDTPGTLWPSFEDQALARHLAYVGCIKDDILNVEELALCLISELRERFGGVLAARYGVDEAGEDYEVMERIGKKRGYVLRGGDIDWERTAKAVLDDFRKQKLGKLALE